MIAKSFPTVEAALVMPLTPTSFLLPWYLFGIDEY